MDHRGKHVFTAADHIIIRDMLAEEGYEYIVPGWVRWVEAMTRTFEKVD